jgi:hypothetical protein
LRATSQSPQSACAPPCHTRARRPLLRHSYRGRFPCGRSRSWQSTSSARCEHTCARGGGGGGGSATGGASDTCVSACGGRVRCARARAGNAWARRCIRAASALLQRARGERMNVLAGSTS